jgi:hypothetical protein
LKLVTDIRIVFFMKNNNIHTYDLVDKINLNL